MYIKRRNLEHARIKRNNRKPKSTDSFLSAFGASFKLAAAWALILLLDFLTDFRFEFLYSCWLFVRTVMDSFRYQGLAFALLFTVISMTSDVLCYFLIPTTLIHLLGSSFVWVQFVWYSDRGFYGPTFVMCFLFVYVEIAVRLRNPKLLPLGIDICRPFAAHCVGYPAVTLGFVLKSMFTHHFRLRKQRSVEAQNLTFFAMLEEALPKELRVYLKSADSSPQSRQSLPSSPAEDSTQPSSVNRIVKDRPSNRKHPSGHGADCTTLSDFYVPEEDDENVLLTHDGLLPLTGADYEPRMDSPNPNDDLSITTDTPDRDVCPIDLSSCAIVTTDSKSTQHFSGTKTSSAANFASNTRTTGTSRVKNGLKSLGTSELQQPGVTISLSSVPGVSGFSKSSAPSKPSFSHAGGKNSQKDEYTLKLESELKQLKSELQSLRSLEIDLRSQVQQLTAAERTYRSENSQARQEAEVLQTKLEQLTQRLQADQATLQTAEKRLEEERKQRAALEQQLKLQQAKTSKHNHSMDVTSKAASSPVTSPETKCVTPRATNVVSQSTNTCTPLDCCCSSSGGGSCTARVKALEAELQALSHDLSSKEVQLTALREERSHSDLRQSLHEKVASDRNELLAKLQCLREENQRMTETLKEEDKMKQELMTAYHTALKEITELNSSLTKKEYQIVELNMRLESLTPQLCDYMNAINMPSVSKPHTRLISSPASTVDQIVDNRRFSPYHSDARYATLSKEFHHPAQHDLYPSDTMASVSSANGFGTLSNAFCDVTYPSSLINNSVFDDERSAANDRLGDLEQFAHFVNGNSDFNRGEYSTTMDSCSFPSYILRSSGLLSTPQFENVQLSGCSTRHRTLQNSRTEYSNNFGSLYSTPGTCPLPIGTVAGSVPSPTPIIGPTGVINRRVPPHNFRRLSSTSHVTTSSLEVVDPPAPLMDMSVPNHSPSSLDTLVESLSSLVPSASSDVTLLTQQFQCQNAFVATSRPPDLEMSGDADASVSQFMSLGANSLPHFSSQDTTAKKSIDFDLSRLGLPTTTRSNTGGSAKSPVQDSAPDTSGVKKRNTRTPPDLLESSRS